MKNYKLYQSLLIKDNHQNFVSQCKQLNNNLKTYFKILDTTWEHDKYNVFSLTSSSIIFYKLYKELNYYIREYLGSNEPLWFTSWLNYHEDNSVDKSLKMHGHNALCHGYISIDPHHTTTEFNNGLKIKNKIGQIYMGPGNGFDSNNIEWNHKVVINSLSSLPRITIAFDVTNRQDLLHSPGYFPLL